MRKLTGGLSVALVAAACYTGDDTMLGSTPTLVDTTRVLFAPAGGAPAHGPTNRATVCLASQYKWSPVIGEPVQGLTQALKRPDGTIIAIHAAVVLPDGTRRPLEPAGYRGCARHTQGVRLAEDVPEVAGARARGVEIWANAPVQIDSVSWWSGDSRRLTVYP